ncbi:hypothetical protein FRB93_006416 [Tulasnella sp. JGI-2019a]|nr:hypothetical protein FRB93_006416 [Tulasnella sp. JGI-2019a]
MADQGAGLGALPKSAPNLPDEMVECLAIQNIRDYLSLLKSIHVSIGGKGTDTDHLRRLHPIFAKATGRFETWITKCLRGRDRHAPLKETELPPLDVLVIFHAFILSPRVYAEDTQQRFHELSNIGAFPLREVANRINVTGEYKPLPEQIDFWEKQTGQPFDISSAQSEVKVMCPACRRIHNTNWVVAEDGVVPGKGTGFGERKFALECNCGVRVTHEVLCVAKLSRDLNEFRASNTMVLRGTLLAGRGGAEQFDIARTTTSEVLRVLGDPATLGRRVLWSMGEVSNQLKVAFDSDSILKLLRPYSQPSSFSVNLPLKASRQGCFASDCFTRGFHTASTETLKNFKSEYLAFFFRDKTDPVFVTSQVDLVWHTHQLLGDGYRRHSIALTGRFIDHRSPDEMSTSPMATLAKRNWKEALAAERAALALDSQTRGVVHDAVTVPEDNNLVDGAAS